MCPILGTNTSSKNVTSASQEDMWGIDYEMSQTYRLRDEENQSRVASWAVSAQPKGTTAAQIYSHGGNAKGGTASSNARELDIVINGIL